MRPQYQKEIEYRIEEYTGGYAFTAMDFLDIASMPVVNEALHRMNRRGDIERVISGVYYKPKYNELIGEKIVARMEDVAEALVRKFNWSVAPAGNTALNMLHLSTQVPNVWTYVSDGPYRKYEVGKRTIEFKHVKSGDIAGKNRITVMVIQALRTIGKENVSKKHIDTLRRTLANQDKQIVLAEARTATSWVYEAIKEVCKEVA